MHWFRRVQRFMDFPVRGRCGKIQFYGYWLRDFSLIFHGDLLESESQHLFRQLIREGKFDCLLDVGANIGFYSWIALNEHPDITVKLYEPDASTAKLLDRTIQFNHYINVEVYAGAVSASPGIVRFLSDPISGAAGSIIDQTGNPSSLHAAYDLHHWQDVECTTLDQYFDELAGRKLMIKIDVEGALREVLAGTQKLLDRNRPTILAECGGIHEIQDLLPENYGFIPLPQDGNLLLYPSEDRAMAQGLTPPAASPCLQ